METYKDTKKIDISVVFGTSFLSCVARTGEFPYPFVKAWLNERASVAVICIGGAIAGVIYGNTLTSGGKAMIGMVLSSGCVESGQ